MKPLRQLMVALVTAGVVIMSMLTAYAQLPAEADGPRTLYKVRNIEIARENVERYEWARKIADGFTSRVSLIMGKDRAWIEDMLPELTPGVSYGQVCPRCVGEQCSMGESGVMRWSVSNPDQLTCKYCGAVYPDPEFPETGTLTAPKMGQSFTYYIPAAEAAHPEDRTGAHAYRWASWPVHVSFSGLIRLNRAQWVAGQALPLAKAWVLTGDAEYAERCAWVLDALAQRYPRWLYHTYYGTVVDLPPAEVAAEYGANPPSGKFDPEVLRTAFPEHAGSLNAKGFWGAGRLHAGVGGEGSFLLNCTVAYDLIREAVYEDGTPVLTAEMHERITRDLIEAGCSDLENYARIDNKCGPGRALSAAVGQLFEQPQRVRRGLEGLTTLLEQCFHFDGFCMESPSYSSMHLGGLYEIPDLIAGDSDPAGYQAEDGTRFDSLNPYRDLPRYRLALLSMVRMLTPDLKFPVIGDTHSGGGIASLWAEILADHFGAEYAALLESAQGAALDQRGSEYALWNRPPDLTSTGDGALPLRSEYFPGWQVAVLRNGDPHGRNALYLNGNAYHGHRHEDTLGLIYFALGQEMASDRGYIWDAPRNGWTRSTLAHNLVTVDGQNQQRQGRTSTVELFGAAPGIEVVQSSANAYEQCSQYRRTVALVQLPGDNSYAVDIFRVTGGNLHQWTLNSNGSDFTLHDQPLTAEEGVITIGSLRWGLENLRVARPQTPWRGTWTNEHVRLDVLMPSPADRVVVADAPGWRSYRGDQLHAPPITQVLAERSGEALDSVFAAVLAPWEGEASPIISVREVRPDDSGAVAVVVEVADRTDWLLSALDDQPRSYEGIEMTGRLGFVSFDAAGALRAMYLHEGTLLRAGDEAIELAEARVECAVTAVDGLTLTLAQPVPADLTLPGAHLLGAGTGWEIARAEGRSISVRDYPLVPLESVTVAMSAWRGPVD